MTLGFAPYLNTLPLTFFLDVRYDKVAYPPSKLLNLLNQRVIDAALLPIVDYFEAPSLYIVPHISVATRSRVRSVRLFVRNSQNFRWNKLASVALDSDSKTSRALLKVLLKFRFEIDLEKIRFMEEEERQSSDAVLWIGDKALERSRENVLSFDLGEIWTEWTGKPFVFAAWMTQDPDRKDLTKRLRQARDQGLERIEEIIETTTKFPKELIRSYLTQSICYALGPEEQEGIKLFYHYWKRIEGYPHELNLRFVSEN